MREEIDMKNILIALLIIMTLNSYAAEKSEYRESEISNKINQIVKENGRVSILINNNTILLTGQVNKQILKDEIENFIKTSISTNNLLNQIEVTQEQMTLSERANDVLIVAKVRAAFIDNNNQFDKLIKVHVEKSMIYLMGQVTTEEGKKAAEIASYVKGAKRIYKVFEYILIEERNNNLDKLASIKNKDIENERQQLVVEQSKLEDERKKFEKEKRNKELARNIQRINLQVTNTQPNSEGDFVINIQTGTDTASLKINGEELGGRVDGNYAIKKVARAGQETKFTIVARDINGNTDSKTIAVTRQVTASNTIKYAELNPALVKTQPSKDAVAIIIGIQNYKRVPKAEYANNDAQAFYDYAIRALGVKPENIKLLVDEQADEVEILSAFQNWLPVKVRKQKTDVYVYYSGHGLPSDDGNSLYILPHGADRQFIAKTAINQQEVVAALQAAQPKSVTMFMDACYSGQIRTGENLIASARPVSIKSNAQLFPAEFTVITASQSDQIASSSADFKHGIFSYYLMKGMEGDADENKDNKITVGEMQSYLQDMVGRKAMSVNRKQIPQLTGDSNKVLVGK
jgi:osmotically-inducible protein OsmY